VSPSVVPSNDDLAALLSTKFEEQLTRYESDLLEVVAPYERFLETERTKLEGALAALRSAEEEVATLEARNGDFIDTPGYPARRKGKPAKRPSRRLESKAPPSGEKSEGRKIFPRFRIAKVEASEFRHPFQSFYTPI
jgi:hypothetical protein